MRKFTPELLRSLRTKANMTRLCLSGIARVSESTIKDYERGRYSPPEQRWRRMLAALSPADTRRRPKPEVLPEPVKFTFSEGHYYTIRDNNTCGEKYRNNINPAFGTMCIFRYEGTRGIHHCFIETRGGWRRTYTNAQLIGKKIKEVVQ